MTTDSSKNDQLDEILANYVLSEEAGESVSRDELLSQHPDLAAELNAFFAGRDQFKRLASPLSPKAARRNDLPAKVRYFGDYELLEEISQGGMGVVYKARQTSLNRIVAVKMILAGHLATEADVQRFTSEAQTAASLKHKAIVPIHEVGQQNGQHYFSMDFIDGRNLAEVIRTAPPSPEEAARIAKSIAEAVDYAHNEGVVHRDIKPSNILIDDSSQVHVTDFGLALRVEFDSDLTRTGQVLGTPSYMPPEQAQGKRDLVGPSTDIYSLGAVLYDLLAGRPPFRGESAADTIRQLIDTEPLPPRQLNRDTPRDLETICLKCLEKEPHKRYRTAALLSDDLGRYLAGEPILARPSSKAERAARWCRRNPAIAGLAAVVAMLLLVVGVGGVVVGVQQSWLAEENSELAAAERDARIEAQERGEQLAAKSGALERQLHVTEAMRLVSESRSVREQYPARSLLLAIEAAQATKAHGEPILPEAYEILLNAPATVGGWPLVGHDTPVTALATAADGRSVITASGATVRIWGLPFQDSRSPDRLLHSDSSSTITSFAVSADFRWLATGSANGNVWLWDVSTGGNTPIHRLRHESPITCMQFSADHRWLVVGGSDGRARLVALTREDFPSRELRYHNSSISSLAISEEGDWLVTGSYGQIVRWDLNAESPEGTAVAYARQRNWPTTLKISKGRILSAGHDGRVRWWPLDARKGRTPLFELRGHKSSVNAMTVSSNGRWLASASSDGSLRLWDLTADAPAASSLELLTHGSEVACVTITQDNRRLIAGSHDAVIRVWNLDAFNPAKSMKALRGHERSVHSIAVSKDGRWLASAAMDGLVRVWNLDAPGALARKTSTVATLKASPNNRWLVSGTVESPWPRDARQVVDPELSDLRSLDPAVFRQQLPKRPARVVTRAASPSGRWIVTAYLTSKPHKRQQGFLEIFDTAHDGLSAPVRTIAYEDEPLHQVAVSNDGQWVVAVNESRSEGHVVHRWNVATVERQTVDLSRTHSYYMQLSGDGRWCVASSYRGDTRVWDLHAPHPNKPCFQRTTKARELTEGGRWLITTSTDDDVELWDLQAKRPFQSSCQLTQRVLCRVLDASPNGQWAVSDDERGGLWLWRLRKGQASKAIPLVGHLARITTVSFDPNNQWLATASADHTVRLWPLEANAARKPHIISLDTPPTALRMSPDGQWLAIGCQDEVARLYRLPNEGASAHEPIVLRGLRGRVSTFTFTHDSQWLIASVSDRTIRFWNLQIDSLISRVRSLVGRDWTEEESRKYFPQDQVVELGEVPANLRHPTEMKPAAMMGVPPPQSTTPWQVRQWPMWGGDASRNMVNLTSRLTTDFEPPQHSGRGRNVNENSGNKLLWSAALGSQTYGPPVVAGGKVFVSTNNGGQYRAKHTGDRGCLLCFDEASGTFLWQLTREKLPAGRVNDWPEQGIVSIACVEGDRLWVVTNRAELMCLDTNGFHDGVNDGAYAHEVDSELLDADIVWSLDMIEELGVFPHNLAISSPVISGDLVFIVTGNGVDEAHIDIPSYRAPSFLAVNKHTGAVVWEDNSPEDRILHGQWSSPAIGSVNGETHVYMAGGDGWLYAFKSETGDLIWKFDLNPKDARWELGGRGTRNSIIATPVFYDDSVVLAVGQDPEHGVGVGHLYRIDATMAGDISPVTPDNEPNPNSGQIWHYGGIDKDGSVTGSEGNEIFRRTLSTAAVHDGFVYLPDLSGRIHCVDFESGRRYWEADMLAAIWGSAMYVDGKVLVGDEDGMLNVFQAGKELKLLEKKEFLSSIYSTSVIANDKLFVVDRSHIYVFSAK